MALLVAGSAEAVAPGANGRVAFVCEDGMNRANLCTIKPDGTDRRQITNFAEGARKPAWSPDGTRLAFVVGGSSLWIANADGSSPRKLTDAQPQSGEMTTANTMSKPSWSPQSDRLAFSEVYFTNDLFAPGRIFSIRSDGTARQRVTIDSAQGQSQASDPVWSPNSDDLIFQIYDPSRDRSPGLYRAGSDGSGVRPLRTRDRDQAYFFVGPAFAWSPTGSEIVARGQRNNGPDALLRLDAQTGSTIAEVPPLASALGGPTYSPDGSRLLANRPADDPRKVASFDLTGADERVVACNAGGDPDWQSAGSGPGMGIGSADCSTKPGCANGLDDDGDGTIDFPADAGCDDPADTDERDLVCGAKAPTQSDGKLLKGTGGPDTLRGSPLRDEIRGLGGDDRIAGNAGDDCIAGGDGNDKIVGNAGADRIDGGGGQDRIDGKDGDDTVVGGAGGDILTGGAGRDKIVGGEGNDLLTDGLGANTYDAGPGDDYVSARQSIAETIDCGPGNDEALVDRKDTVINCEEVTRIKPGRPRLPRAARGHKAAARSSGFPTATWFQIYSPRKGATPYYFGHRNAGCYPAGKSNSDHGTIAAQALAAEYAKGQHEKWVKFEWLVEAWATNQYGGEGWMAVPGAKGKWTTPRTTIAYPWWSYNAGYRMGASGEHYRLRLRTSFMHNRIGGDRVARTPWFTYVSCQSVVRGDDAEFQ